MELQYLRHYFWTALSKKNAMFSHTNQDADRRTAAESNQDDSSETVKWARLCWVFGFTIVFFLMLFVIPVGRHIKQSRTKDSNLSKLDELVNHNIRVAANCADNTTFRWISDVVSLIISIILVVIFRCLSKREAQNKRVCCSRLGICVFFRFHFQWILIWIEFFQVSYRPSDRLASPIDM
jgi:hypothetical protein